MKDKLELKAEFDLKEFKELVKATPDLISDQNFFQSLAQFKRIKSEFDQLGEELAEAEKEIKQAINDRAKATFGDQWQAIAGDRWKISRSWSGSVYTIDDLDKASDFIKLAEPKPDTDAIDEFVAKNSALPEGVSRNDNRSEVIRISVDDDY